MPPDTEKTAAADRTGEAGSGHFIYREAPTSRVRTISASDVLELLRLPVFCILARLVPARSWGAFSRFLADAMRGWRPWSAKKTAPIAAALGPRKASLSPAEIRTGLVAGRYEQRLQLMRFYPFGEWDPVIHTPGIEHIRQSLEHGKGVVLWVVPFHNGGLFAKMGLWRAGVPVSHLSRPGHGFSGTRFGIRVLNPIRSRVEDRFLAERLLIVEGDTTSPVERIFSRLRDNKAVTITVSSVEGRRLIRMPFLGGEITLATGAPSICHTSGAALLPVFPVKTGENEFAVNIGAPLPLADTKERSISLATAGLLRQLEPFVLKYPDQWHGWRNVAPATEGRPE